MNHRLSSITVLCLIAALGCGCSSLVKVRLFTSQRDPLRERVLRGSSDRKIAMIPISGVISDAPGFSLFRSKPSVVQEVVSQLRLAENDPDVKAVLLKIDTPGGSVTASDVLYHEIAEFKKRSGKKVVTMMMDMATSGGYYVALPSDAIIAHPTTITGSVGVIFLRPKVVGLMDKIGVNVDVNKSGVNKDMGSPFRRPTKAEDALFQALIDELGKRFVTLVENHRSPSKEAMKSIASARVFLADEALKLGLIDQIGYLDDAVAATAKRANLPEDPTVVAYRRDLYPDDNLYNNASCGANQKPDVSLVNIDLLDALPELKTGFHYLWTPGIQH